MKECKKHFKFFQYVGDTPIISIKLKILTVFIVMLLLSTFSTNLISVMLSQRKVFELTNIILVDKLTEIFNAANNQKQIESYSQDTAGCLKNIEESARNGFDESEVNGLAFGLNPDGSFLFMANANPSLSWNVFSDEDALAEMEDEVQGSLNFKGPDGDEYYGVYKYHSEWLTYIVRANRRSDISRSMFSVFAKAIVLIVIVAFFFIYMGTKILDGLLSNIRSFSKQIYAMQQSKKLVPLDISGAPNDDITYLAANFNSLSLTIDNLMQIFQKFVPENVVKKAKEEQLIRLEGRQRELTVLFSDIKSFTYRTEILGNDIIGLLNVHYDSVIRKVSNHNGIIGSIIGDAILASYGIEENISSNKSYDAIKSAWEITAVTEELRGKMVLRRRILEEKRPFTESEEKVYNAVMLDVGVGIDGGNVFYGNIGSDERMANTVIGDNVNSASRLEGLTRIYKVPVIVSEYIKNDACVSEEAKARYDFYEIDTVFVKGKTEGVKIYFPLDRLNNNSSWAHDLYKEKFDMFSVALKKYYEGDWNGARDVFKKTELEICSVFLERMGDGNAPENWSGIWTMTTK